MKSTETPKGKAAKPKLSKPRPSRPKPSRPKPSRPKPSRPQSVAVPSATDEILHHWREAVPNDRLAHLVKDATRGLVRALTSRLAKHKVSFGHWVFLRILWEHDGLTQRELSLHAGLMEPTAFSALTAMERAGYVTRRKMPDNRKNVHVFLTPKGRALRAVLVPLAEEVNRTAVAGVAAADVATTRRILLAMIESLAVDEGRRKN
jgi:MarR family transcriptional regulator, organic hydroperoxide resistance regulator